MTDVVIEVFVPDSADIEAITDTVDLTADPSGAAVVLVAAPGPPGPRGVPGNGASVYNEPPGGARNGINATFTLAFTPVPGSTAVYRNGLREIPGVGYTQSGTTLVFATAPLADDVLTVDYLIGS